jgi:hypothetical protein
MKSYKTTILGVISIITAIIGVVTGLLNNTPVDWNATITAIMAGIGLVFAKDSNVTGGTVQQ